MSSIRPLKFKSVLRYDPRDRRFRLCRFFGTIGKLDGTGFSYKLSFAYSLRDWWRIRFQREYYGWTLIVIGIRIHWQKAWGSHFC